MGHVLTNLLKKQLGPNPWQVNPLVPTIWNIGKATIEEECDTEEWMDSSDKTSVNRPFSNDLDDFNNITIWYIGTDASLTELHTELSINATLKPSNTFVFKYRTQDTLTAEEKVLTEYHEYLDIFKEKVERFPESRP